MNGTFLHASDHEQPMLSELGHLSMAAQQEGPLDPEYWVEERLWHAS